jgi:hypothetical protein
MSYITYMGQMALLSLLGLSGLWTMSYDWGLGLVW